MKKILITGENSYIGTSFEKWIEQYHNKYIVHTVDMKTDNWKTKDFSQYDVVFHVAGIAHVRETNKNRELYYKVNRDLAYETAKKAKSEGVKQFIFLSSMSVYGKEKGAISKNSDLKPNSNYGKSKLQAEKLIEPLRSERFKVVILRPPMVYGRGCRGNYPRLSKLAVRIPIFPDINNKRSMIYIDNLCEFIRLLIDRYCSGIYYPQNSEYVSTSNMVKMIAEVHEKKIILTKLFNPIIKLFKTRTVIKVFGSLIYEKKMSYYEKNYCVKDFESSIRLTEIGK